MERQRATSIASSSSSTSSMSAAAGTGDAATPTRKRGPPATTGRRGSAQREGAAGARTVSSDNGDSALTASKSVRGSTGTPRVTRARTTLELVLPPALKTGAGAPASAVDVNSPNPAASPPGPPGPAPVPGPAGPAPVPSQAGPAAGPGTPPTRRTSSAGAFNGIDRIRNAIGLSNRRASVTDDSDAADAGGAPLPTPIARSSAASRQDSGTVGVDPRMQIASKHRTASGGNLPSRVSRGSTPAMSSLAIDPVQRPGSGAGSPRLRRASEGPAQITLSEPHLAGRGEAATGAAPDAATPAGLLSPSMRPWLPLRLALGEAQAVPARTTAHSSLRPTCRLCLPRLTRAGLTGWETRAHTQHRRRRPCPGARKACGSRPSWPLRRCRMRTRTTRAAARTRTPRPPPSRPVPQPDRRTPPAPPGRCSPPHCILVHTRAH